MSIATSNLSPKANKQGKVVKVDQMYLDEIPAAMDKMGWRVSAALMRRWFRTRPAWVMAAGERVRVNFADVPSSRLEEDLVRMNWLLRYPAVRSAAERLVQNWASPNGLALLRKRLAEAGWKPGKCTSLGYGVEKASAADSLSQVNLQGFGSYVDTFDDLFGAINKGVLKICVRGSTTQLPLSGRDVFEIERIGIYCRDTYDFAADWHMDNTFGLGIWSRDRCLSKTEIAAYVGMPVPLRALTYGKFVPVRNADFRRWQKARDEGGDFFVFSDVHWIDSTIKHVPLA